MIASNAARVQPVGSDDARERALAVFSALPAAMRAERAMLQRGLDSGVTTSRPVIAAVIRQLGDLLPADVTKSPLYAPAQRDSSESFRARWRALLTAPTCRSGAVGAAAVGVVRVVSLGLSDARLP